MSPDRHPRSRSPSGQSLTQANTKATYIRYGWPRPGGYSPPRIRAAIQHEDDRAELEAMLREFDDFDDDLLKLELDGPTNRHVDNFDLPTTANLKALDDCDSMDTETDLTSESDLSGGIYKSLFVYIETNHSQIDTNITTALLLPRDLRPLEPTVTTLPTMRQVTRSRGSSSGTRISSRPTLNRLPSLANLLQLC